MAIGERDWESEFFVGFAPSRISVIKGIEITEEDTTLTEDQRQSLLKTYKEVLKAIEQITYDPLGGKPEQPASILKKYMKS